MIKCAKFYERIIMTEHRQPFFLFVSESKESPRISKADKAKNIVSVYAPLAKRYYVLQKIDSDLLVAIDNNDVLAVQNAFKKDNIDVNRLYLIPSWEVPDAGRPLFQTFLHRSMTAHSVDVFGFLLENGANPKIKGHCNDTVIENLFDGYTSEGCIEAFGKMLIDAGVRADEIKKTSRLWNCRVKETALDLIRYAREKQKISSRQGVHLSDGHVRD